MCTVDQATNKVSFGRPLLLLGRQIKVTIGDQSGACLPRANLTFPAEFLNERRVKCQRAAAAAATGVKLPTMIPFRSRPPATLLDGCAQKKVRHTYLTAAAVAAQSPKS